MYQTSQTTVKCYDEDITEVLWTKSLDDINRWRRSTTALITRLSTTPDRSKGDPEWLINKLHERVKQIDTHLLERESLLRPPTSHSIASGTTVNYGSLNVKLMPKPKSSPLRNSTSSSGSIRTSPPEESLTPMEERILWRTPPPHQRPLPEEDFEPDPLLDIREKEGMTPTITPPP